MARKPKQTFDPIAILRAIAADDDASAVARVTACKVLLAHERDNAETEQPADAPPSDAITRKALKLLKGGKP